MTSSDEPRRSAKSELLKNLFPIVRQAGAAILSVRDAGFETESKEDGSPVTKADRLAEKIILDGLQRVAPDIPVVSEENASSHMMKAPEQFFLVDPLDGTKEFAKQDGNGHYTVNIGLIEDGAPVLGVVFAPALDQLYAGVVGEGAALSSAGKTHIISTRGQAEGGPVALTSISFPDAETEQWLAQHRITKTIAVGSSLKFGMLAKGDANIYARMGPTMEWDTAAGDVVLRAAGGAMTDLDGSPFTYGKKAYRNGPFIASGAVSG